MGNSHGHSHDGAHGHSHSQGSSVPTATPARGPSETARKFFAIPDKFRSLDEVQSALRAAGLESSNLIVGVDFTKSNEWTGKVTRNGLCLHDIAHGPSPYGAAISAIGRTLSPFDDDRLIPAYGFGDATTTDDNVFSFKAGDVPCNGFEEVLACYLALAPHVRLAGPTTFGPLIRRAIQTVAASGHYHVLLIIADGQVTRPEGTPAGTFSPQEQDTANAIVEASRYPLSIIMVGVGDGPWDAMREFDDHLPVRDFDNFQFVNYSSAIARAETLEQADVQFAVAALQEIPDQFRACARLCRKSEYRCKAPLNPPVVFQPQPPVAAAYAPPLGVPAMPMPPAYGAPAAGGYPAPSAPGTL